MTRRWTILSVTLCIVLQGCGTIAQATDRQGPAIFGGTRLDGLSVYRLAVGPDELEKDTLGPGLRWLLIPLVIVDLPLSLALDVVMLPFSIPNELSEGGIEVEQDLPAIGAR